MSNNYPLIAPSLLSADFSRLKEEVQAVETAGADLLHLDVMDGVYVPNITFGPLVISALRPHTKLPFDVHLMIVQPERYIGHFAQAGADWICIHAEATPHLHRGVSAIKELGKKAGVSLNPHTPLEVLDYILEELDFVLIMSVNPGFGGQRFISQTLRKIERLKRTLVQRSLPVLVEVDGGINEETAAQVISAGADILVAGTAVFGKKDYAQAISALRSPK
ncbi:MAG: ribulose-phosphate 3-epimerase [Caldimicrobium sp.]|nr:ribulose-phosphate 3-epimerase [Caldimicrobium sp.]MDW8094994.1 ribulose-phosphate 3-epimerase [Caldimicrobium sp.]